MNPGMSAALDSDTYRATRAAWERIWTEEADSTRELMTVDYPRSRAIRSLYMPHLAGAKRVVEAGCGLGVELVGLDRQGIQAVGIDFALGALARLYAYRPDFHLAGGDVHRLPFPRESFDAYLSFGVLEHFEFGPIPALKEANRVLRPGGLLVVSVPSPNLIWRWVRARRRSAPSPGPEYFETAYSVDGLEASLRGTGFRVIARHPVGHSFTLWGLGFPFRGPGYYETSDLAERLGGLLLRLTPWAMAFASLVIGRKTASA